MSREVGFRVALAEERAQAPKIGQSDATANCIKFNVSSESWPFLGDT